MENNTQTDASQAIGTLKAIVKILIIAAGLFMAWGAFFTVGPGEAGVIFDRGEGVLNQTFDEGLHLKIPWWQDSHVFTTRIQKYRQDASAASNDMQEVQTTVALNFHLPRSQVHTLYKRIGPDYKKRIIEPAIQEVVKAVTAKYDAQQLIENRSSAKQDIDRMLTQRLERNYISVDEVSIENFQFTKAFDEAIENKEIARQKALEERNRLEAVEYRAEQRRAEANGEADAIRIINEQLANSPNYVKWYMIDQWNGDTQTIVPFVEGGSGTPLIELPTANSTR